MRNVLVGSLLMLGGLLLTSCEDSFQQASYSPASVTPKHDPMPGGPNQVVVSTASATFRNTAGSTMTISPGVEATQNGISNGGFNTKFNSGGWEIRTNVSWSGSNGYGGSVGAVYRFN
jgi:hypothetical protein